MRHQLIGKKFNKLFVIEELPARKTGSSNCSSMWLCKCDCGNIKKAVGTNLVHNRTLSCGCYKKPRKNTKNGLTRLYSQYKTSAKSRNLDFNLTLVEFESLTVKNCDYCSTEPKLRNTYLTLSGKLISAVTQHRIDNSWFKLNGLDRIDSSSGYSLQNCVPCCEVCNWMKSNMTREEFLQHIKKIQMKASCL